MENRLAKKTIKNLFERRQFTTSEREAMKELYTFGELLANQIIKAVPDCEHQLRAVLKIKEALGDCETALALNPKCDKQAEMKFEMKFNGTPVNCDAENDSISAPTNAQVNKALETLEMAAHARR
jgi:hypothetical protein